MGNKIAVVVAVITFFAIKMSLDAAGSALGIANYIDFGASVTVDRGLYDEEVNGATTDFGMFGFVAATMIAWRVYHCIRAGKLDGNLTKVQGQTWLVWFVGAAIYTALSVAVNRLGLPHPLPLIVKLGIAGATYYLCRRWYDHQQQTARLADEWAASLTKNLNENVRAKSPTH